MNEAVYKKLFPDLYVDRFIENNIRVDGRDFGQHRQVMIQKCESFQLNILVLTLFGPNSNFDRENLLRQNRVHFNFCIGWWHDCARNPHK